MWASYFEPIGVGLGRIWHDLIGPTILSVRGYSIWTDVVLQSLVAIAELIWIGVLMWARRARQEGLNRRLGNWGLAAFGFWLLLLALYQIHIYEVSLSYLLEGTPYPDSRYQKWIRMTPATRAVTISGLLLVVSLVVQFWTQALLRPLLGCDLVVTLIVAGSVFRFLPDSSIICSLSAGTSEEQQFAWERQLTTTPTVGAMW